MHNFNTMNMVTCKVHLMHMHLREDCIQNRGNKGWGNGKCGLLHVLLSVLKFGQLVANFVLNLIRLPKQGCNNHGTSGGWEPKPH